MKGVLEDPIAEVLIAAIEENGAQFLLGLGRAAEAEERHDRVR